MTTQSSELEFTSPTAKRLLAAAERHEKLNRERNNLKAELAEKDEVIRQRDAAIDRLRKQYEERIAEMNRKIAELREENSLWARGLARVQRHTIPTNPFGYGITSQYDSCTGAQMFRVVPSLPAFTVAVPVRDIYDQRDPKGFLTTILATHCDELAERLKASIVADAVRQGL